MNDLTQRVRRLLENKLRELEDESKAALLLKGDVETCKEAMRLLFYDKRIDLLIKRKKILGITIEQSESTSIDCITDFSPNTSIHTFRKKIDGKIFYISPKDEDTQSKEAR